MKRTMNILVLGGDGFCGWPTALLLSNEGHNVTIIDSLIRRKIDKELGTSSLTPIASIQTRLETWNRIKGKTIRFKKIDISKEYDKLLDTIISTKPDKIIHFAEQRSAPYSMKSSNHKRYTINNNINSTNNLLCAVVDAELDTHIIHLGTMGVYGYGNANFKIPEGYLDIYTKNEDGDFDCSEILYPANPGSIYHMSKTLDQLIFSFFAKNDKIKITDLHQGIVWGTQTEETRLHKNLINRFDYDGDFGTVLNRFLMQAALQIPLTIYGKGGQTRAFINIQDTVRCIKYAIYNPPVNSSKVEIYNQMTEVHRLADLTEIISNIIDVEVVHLKNPRLEAEKNELNVDNRKFLNHGLKPVTLKEGLLEEIIDIAKKYSKRCKKEKVNYSSFWNNNIRKNILDS